MISNTENNYVVGHIHLILDDVEVMDLDFDGTYTFDNLTTGSHTLTAFLATSDHIEIPGTRKIVNFTSIPEKLYFLTSDTNTVNEGGSFTITLYTQGVSDGTDVPYTITGIQPGDIQEDLTGNFTINNNTATATFNVVEDFTAEGSEIFILTLDNLEDIIGVTINDTSTQSYNLESDETTVNEGESFTITLNTQGVSNGTSVPYTITGINASDITGDLTGNFTIYNNTATKTFNVVEDQLSDGDKIFRLTLNSIDENIDVTIIDTSQLPDFTLTSTVDEVDEDQPDNSITFTLQTTNIDQGEQYDYTISGDNITLSDFTGLASLNGTFTIDENGRDSVTLTLNDDNTLEGEEIFTISLNDEDVSKSIIINDTSIQTYQLTRSESSVDEGESFIVTLNTQGLSNGTNVPYTITGIQADDIQEDLTGNFTINNNTATATFNVVEDNTTEGNQTFTLTLNDLSESISVILNDTSTSPGDQPLSVLYLGASKPFDERNQDSGELFTNNDYVQPNGVTTLNDKIDSDNYDLIVFNNVNWVANGILKPVQSTYDKLKEFVERGGVIFDCSEHFNYYVYDFQNDNSSVDGTVSNIVYDLGGVNTPTNSGWKTRSTTYDTLVVTTIANTLNIIELYDGGGVENPDRASYFQTIQNSKSNGYPLVYGNNKVSTSVIHLWDGGISGQLNSGVNGKIIMLGEAIGIYLSDYFTTSLLNYIARTKA